MGKFSVTDFRVRFIEQNLVTSTYLNAQFKGETQQALDQDVVAHWSLVLAPKESPGTSIVIKAETLFRINRDNKVSFAQIGACFVNGNQVSPMLWPDVGAFEDSGNLESIEDWIRRFSATYQPPSSDSSLSIGDPPTDDSGINKAIATLKADFPKILRQEPHWNVFADDVTLVDQTGTALIGVQNNQLLTSLLRKLPRKFSVKNVKVVYLETTAFISWYKDGKFVKKMQEPLTERSWRGQGSERVLQLGWKVDINTKEWFWKRSRPLTLRAETVVTMNAEGLIDAIVVDKITVNGWDVLAWPDVDLSEAPESSMEFIEQWIQDIKFQLTEQGEEYVMKDDMTRSLDFDESQEES